MPICGGALCGAARETPRGRSRTSGAAGSFCAGEPHEAAAQEAATVTSWRGVRVLVTGGTGFIGSRLVRSLVREEAEVHLLVRKTSKPDRLGPAWGKVRRHEGDLRDGSSLAACVRAAQPQFVFHLARERGGAPLEEELGATLRLAEALRSAPGVLRWVRTALASRPGYGASEEAFLRERLGRRYGLSTVTLELFKVYGPGQDLDKFPADLVRDALDGRGLSVAPQGLQDFVYVEDVVEAYLLAATKPAAEGGTFQIGSGRVRTSEEAAAVVLRRLGLEGTVETRSAPGSLRSGEGQPAEVEPARRALGWSPRISFEQGVDELIAWQRSIAPDPVPGGRGGKLLLLGLGPEPAAHVTVETLLAMTECGVLYLSGVGRDDARFFGRLSRRVVVLRGGGGTQAREAGRVLRDLAAGATVGLAARGHAFLHGGLAADLVRRCAGLGLPWTAYGAVSSLGASMAATGRTLGEDIFAGQAFDARALAEGRARPNPTWPLAVHCYRVPTAAVVERAFRVLRGLYPLKHPVAFVHGGVIVRTVPLDEAAGALRTSPPGTVLFLEPASPPRSQAARIYRPGYRPPRDMAQDHKRAPAWVRE